MYKIISLNLQLPKTICLQELNGVYEEILLSLHDFIEQKSSAKKILFPKKPSVNKPSTMEIDNGASLKRESTESNAPSKRRKVEPPTSTKPSVNTSPLVVLKKKANHALTVEALIRRCDALENLINRSPYEKSVQNVLGSTKPKKKSKKETKTPITNEELINTIGPELLKLSEIFCTLGNLHMKEKTETAHDFYKTAKNIISFVLAPNNEKEDEVSQDPFIPSEDTVLNLVDCHFKIAEWDLSRLQNEDLDFKKLYEIAKEGKSLCRRILKTLHVIDDEHVREIYKNQTWNIYQRFLEFESDAVLNKQPPDKQEAPFERACQKYWQAIGDYEKYHINLPISLLKIYHSLAYLFESNNQEDIGPEERFPHYAAIFSDRGITNLSKAYEYYHKQKVLPHINKEPIDQILLFKSGFPTTMPFTIEQAKFRLNEVFTRVNERLTPEICTAATNLLEGKPSSQLASAPHLLLQVKRSTPQLSKLFAQKIESKKAGLSVSINGLLSTVRLPRFYHYKPVPNESYARKAIQLQKWCKENGVEIKEGSKAKSYLASLDFAALGHDAYDTESVLPTFYNLLLWKFDDYIDEQENPDLEQIQALNIGIIAILNGEEVAGDTPLFKIARAVRELMEKENVDPKYWESFIVHTKDTFDSQKKQANRKKTAAPLPTPEEFEIERRRFSGVRSSLELCARICGITDPNTIESDYIQKIWDLVNLIVSHDNCLDSFVKEFFIDRDTENFVFSKYADKLKRAGIEITDRADYFKNENIIPEAIQEAMQETASYINSLYVELQELLLCKPTSFSSKEQEDDFNTCIEAAMLWLNALPWSKQTARYTGNPDPLQLLSVMYHN